MMGCLVFALLAFGDMDFCSQCATFGPLLIRAVPKEPDFFLFRAALKDHPSGHFTTDDLT